MCINPKVRLGLAFALGLEFGFIHILGAFKERRNNGESLSPQFIVDAHKLQCVCCFSYNALCLE